MDNKRQLELIEQLTEICNELGWDIVVPGTPENDVVDGLILGNEKFVENILDILDSAGMINLEETEVFSEGPEGELVETPKPKSNRTLH